MPSFSGARSESENSAAVEVGLPGNSVGEGENQVPVR
jgi:hypothetical protein